MLVPLLVVTNAHERNCDITVLGEIVMACPDFDMIWQAQELTTRVEEISRIATGEISACSTEIRV